ncbi:MAG: NifB/NifX family molybdenum-iron cluster-binding protein [Thermodesulfobacteriota bacterium]|nr:NifB/NifX family molybdenum-iron cluster-binding protein [Thermodesulfobacteriota bacterium]
MKLCVSATGKDMTAKVDGTFGRAPYLLIVDTDTMEMEALDNTAADVSQGAGIGATQLIADKDADALLTGHVGPKAYTALESGGIKIYEGASTADTVQEAVNKFKQGSTKQSLDAGGEVRCGPGMGMGRGGGRCRGRGTGQGLGPGQGRGRGR